jgi:two-component system NarL family response regulator
VNSVEPLRVLLVDDHPAVRAGIAAMLETDPSFRVIGEAADGEQAFAQYAALRPDLVVMDLRMPKGGGLEATTAIRLRFPEARIVVLTTYDGDEDIFRALQAGARGYLLKTSSRQALLDTLSSVAAGRRVVPPDVAARLAERLPESDLTPREVEVLRHMARGLSNKEIAARIGVAESTVKTFLVNIFGKLGTDDRTGAVTIALRRGILRLEDSAD